MKVRCKKEINDDRLGRKIYVVAWEDPENYYLYDIPGVGWLKEMFEIVEEPKIYSIQEVLELIEEGQKFKCTKENYNIKFIEKAKTGIRFIYANKDREALIIGDNARFTLVKQDKKVSFMDAMRAYREGKEIYCKCDGKGYIYKRKDGQTSVKNIINETITCAEILEGEWFIKEEE